MEKVSVFLGRVRRRSILSLLLIGVLLGSSAGVATAGVALDISIDAPSEATVGESVSISTPISLPDVLGNHESQLSIVFSVDGEQVSTKKITMEDGGETTNSFSHTFESAGSHEVKISAEITLAGKTFSKSASKTVKVSAPETAKKTSSQTTTEESAPTTVEETTSRTTTESGLLGGIQSRTISGAAFSVPESLKDEVESYRQQLPLNDGPKAFVLATEEELFIVFTEKEPQEGIATVNGRAFNTNLSAEGLRFSAVRAKSVSFETTGADSTVGDVNANPSEYQLELVRIQATHRQISTLTDPDQGEDITATTSAGVLVENPTTVNGLMTRPVEQARSFSSNASTDELGSNTQNELEKMMGTNQPRLYTLDFTTSYWIDTESTVDGIVLTPGNKAREFLSTFDASGVLAGRSGEPILYVVDSGFQSKTYESVNAVTQRAEDGDVVTIETNLYGKTASVQETLEHNTACSQTKAQVPTPSGPICIDVTQDTLVQMGAAWNTIPESREDVVFVVGMSSQHLDKPSEELQGRYTIIGEVVSTSRIDDDLPEGKMLLVYEMERTGDIDLRSLSSESRELLGDKFKNLNSSVQSQLGVVAEKSIESKTTTKPTDETDEKTGSGNSQTKSDSVETTVDEGGDSMETSTETVETAESPEESNEEITQSKTEPSEERNDSIIEKTSSTVSDATTAVSEAASKAIKKVSEWF